MAGKSTTSKTARASVRAGEKAGGALSVLGEFKYLIPLNGGKNVYVRNLTTGKTARVQCRTPLMLLGCPSYTGSRLCPERSATSRTCATVQPRLTAVIRLAGIMMSRTIFASKRTIPASSIACPGSIEPSR